MKLRLSIIVFLLALALAACNFTLASDITPPPNYVSPTPMPTLGALYPASAPDVQNGAAIFVERCAPCHGTTGLGDGPQSMQLPVTVPGIGLPEIAQTASPAQWYKVVSQGNLDRFMPPFAGVLSEQDRWDVIAYVLTLHTKPDQLAQGKTLFESNCADCASKFADQEKMSVLSEADLVRIIKNGEGDIPAFGKNFTDDQASAVAAYIRTLTFAPPLTPTPMAAAVSTESAAAVSGTPSSPSGTIAATGTGSTQEAVSGTPRTPAASASTPEVTSVPGKGIVNGTIELAGGNVPAGLTVTLHGFDHAQDQTTGPQEVLTLTATSAADGSYAFENVDLPINRIFVAEVDFGGIKFQSDFGAVKADATQVTLPAVKLYASSEDLSLLSMDQVHIYPDFASAGTVQFYEIYAFSNKSDKAVVISTDGKSIPFIKLPENAQSVGYEAGQDSASFVSADKGVAVVPSDKPYSIIAFFTLPYDKQLEVAQPFALDTSSVIMLFPEGVKVESDQLTSKGIQSFQNVNYEEFSSGGLKAGDTLTFTVSGQPKTGSSSATTPNTTQSLLIGAGILGIALIGAGAWLYLRDRNADETDEDENEFDSSEEVMDAILALDDLHRAGKISDAAYHKRRDELKAILKEMA